MPPALLSCRQWDGLWGMRWKKLPLWRRKTATATGPGALLSPQPSASPSRLAMCC